MPPIGNPGHFNFPQWITPARVALAAWSFILLMVSAGWVMLPAKSGDLSKVQDRLDVVGTSVAKLEISVEKIAVRVENALDRLSIKLDKLQAEQQRDREEIIRLGGGHRVMAYDKAEEQASGKAVVKKVRKPKPAVAKSAQQDDDPGFLGKLLQ